MTIPLVLAGRRQARVFVGYQFLLVFLVAMAGLFFSLIAGLGILVGGLAVIFPAVFFVELVFRHSGARNSKKVVRAFYLGEALKMLLSAVLLVTALLLLTGVEVYVLVGYLLALVGQWLLPFVVKTQ